MSFPSGASRIGTPAERLPGWRRPAPLSVGAAGLALALVLGAIPLGAAPLPASTPGIERTGAKVSAPPDAAGLHPVDYTYERLGPFSGGLAAVKRQGKWGYVDQAGKVVIPFLYDEATPFDAGWASVRRNGRYWVIDKAGTELKVRRPLAQLSRFSGGLAAAKAKSGGPWGYVDWTGAFVIKPQFDKADDFSNGLAAVALNGTWFYVTPAGTVALVTPYYRAYPFTEDGLALVQDVRHGRYGYIRQDGRVVIPPQYPEARPFSQGLAPVRVGDRWGYVGTSGSTAISPRYTEAFPFNGGRALVLDGISNFFFVDSSGNRTHDLPFPRAESFSEGVAIVSDGKKSWYVDQEMSRLPIGEAVPPVVGDSGGCSSGISSGVSTNYINGTTFFQIVNQTTMKWTVTGTDTWAEQNPGPGEGTGMTVHPGLPALVDSGTGPKTGQYTFMHQYNSFAGNPTGTYPLFDLTMTSGPYTIKLSNAVNYTQPPPPPSHPWWDYLGYAFDAMEGLFSVVTGDWAEAALGIAKMVDASYDIAKGTVDGEGNSNDNIATDNVLATSLTVSGATGAFAPLDGGYCGGDSYTVSDDLQWVVALTTVKSQYMPPTVQLTISPYSAYFAQNTLGKIDMYRKGNAPGVGALTGPYASCVYAVVFENFADLTNSTPCSHPAAFPTYDYFTKYSSLDPATATGIWQFANALNTTATEGNLGQLTEYLRDLGGNCGTLPTTCPSVSPMAVSPQACTQSTVEATCSCAFQVTNANGPVGQKQDPNIPLVPATTTCAPAAPFVSPCTITFEPAAGSAPVTIAITDTYTEVPISLSCTAQKMTVQPLTYSASSWPGPCTFNLQVAGPTGPVSTTPSTFVTSNTCTSETSGTCIISLSVPPGTPASTISLSDGKTMLPVSVACADVPMTLSASTFSAWSTTKGQACPMTVGVTNAHGPVVVTPASVKSSSTCTAPGPSCTVALSIPYDTQAPVSFSDGATTASATCTCNGCVGIGLPQGKEYSTTRGEGCHVTVPIMCASGTMYVVSAPTGGSLTPVTCNQAEQCNLEVFSPVGGGWNLGDALGNSVYFTVTCD